MGILFANHAKTFLAEVVEPEQTTIRCSFPEIYTFPSIKAAGDYFYASGIASSTQPALEIVKVVGVDKTAGTIEVVRGVDGTTPVKLPAGLSLEIRLPAAALNDILAIANEGLDGHKLERFAFNTPAQEWVIGHNRGTTLFDEKLWVLEQDGVFRKHLAATEVVDDNNFRIRFSHAVSGYVDVRF